MASEKTSPIFRPRRNQQKLDLRPAIWSVRHHPEEWEWNGSYLTHQPSAFMLRPSGDWYINIRGCDSYRRSSVLWRDRRRMMRAFRRLRRKHFVRTPSAINVRLAAQFVGKAGGYEGEIRLPTGEVLYRGPFPVDPDQVYAYMTAQRLAAE